DSDVPKSIQNFASEYAIAVLSPARSAYSLRTAICSIIRLFSKRNASYLDIAAPFDGVGGTGIAVGSPQSSFACSHSSRVKIAGGRRVIPCVRIARNSTLIPRSALARSEL